MKLNVFFSNAAGVSQCIDTFTSGCDDVTKAVIRYSLQQYTSTVLDDACDITPETLDSAPNLSLVDCLETITSRQINNTEDACNAIGDYADCVAYV